MNRLICRIFGHVKGPWTSIVLLKGYYTKDCPRCKTHRTFSGNGRYAEFYNKELIKKGYL